MLARKHRLVRAGDFLQMFRSGTRVRGPYAQLVYRTNRIALNRVAIVVSTKVDKRAVVRNRLRRRAYEEIRRHSTDMKQGVDIIIRVAPVAATAPRKAWNASIVQLLKRAELMKHRK